MSLDSTDPSTFHNPATFLLNLSRTGGDVVDYRSPGGELVFLVNHPKLAKRVLRNSEGLYFNPHHQYAVLVPLLTEEGALLLRLRHQRSHDVSSSDALENLHQQFARSFPRLRRQLQERVTDASNVTDVTEVLKAHSLQVMTAALFEVDISPFAQEFVAALDHTELGHLPHRRHLAAPMTKDKASATQRRIAAFIARSAVKRKEGREIRFPPHEWESLVTSVLRTVLNSYNALAISTSWSLRLLAQHPEWQTRLTTEAQQVLGRQTTLSKAIASLQDTRRFVQESLRVFPPAWVLGRNALQAHELGGVDIPTHSRVLVSPYAMHRRLPYWENPSEFQPDRFDDSRGVSLIAYCPFGGGARTCPAANLALACLQHLLAALTRSFHFQTISHSSPIPYGATSLQPYPHNILRIEPRHESTYYPDTPREALSPS